MESNQIETALASILLICAGFTFYFAFQLNKVRKGKVKHKLSIEDYRTIRQSIAVKMDSTKRKSLMPANRFVTPPRGFELPDGEERRTSTKARVSPQKPKTTPVIDKGFEHKFFGTSLTVGGNKLASGLNNGLHRMEITKAGMFIDNKQYVINSGDLERIKILIRESRK